MEQMTHYALLFLRRKKIAPADIRYLIRTGAQTELHLLDGRTLNTYIGLKAFSDALPKEDFLRINKGVLLAKSQIVKIYRGTYLTTDGKNFTGRTHDPIQHKTIMKELAKNQARYSKEVSAELNTRFSVLDIMPAPFCVIELYLRKVETTFIFHTNDSMGELPISCSPEDDETIPFTISLKMRTKDGCPNMRKLLSTAVPRYFTVTAGRLTGIYPSTVSSRKKAHSSFL